MFPRKDELASCIIGSENASLIYTSLFPVASCILGILLLVPLSLDLLSVSLMFPSCVRFDRLSSQHQVNVSSQCSFIIVF